MNESVVRVNLRVLAKLQPGDRLQCCDSKYFGVDRGYLVWAWRWWKGDTRHIALERLDDTIRCALALVEQNEDVKLLLRSASEGIMHLLDTYHTDATTVARLENLVARCSEDEEVEL